MRHDGLQKRNRNKLLTANICNQNYKKINKILNATTKEDLGRKIQACTETFHDNKCQITNEVHRVVEFFFKGKFYADGIDVQITTYARC